MNIPENFDRWMFDFREGNLSSAEKEAFENFLIQNPQFEAEADAWNNSFIQNEEFTFPNVKQLEKDNRIVSGWYGYAVAAVILLLIGSSVAFFKQNKAEVNGFTSDREASIDDAINSHEIASPRVDKNLSALVDDANNNPLQNGVGVALINNNVQNNPFNNQGINNSLNGNNSNGNKLVNNLDNGNNNNFHNLNNNRFDPNQDNKLSFNNQEDRTNNINANDFTDPTNFENAMDQEIAKLDGEGNSSKYQGNPENSNLSFDVGNVNSGYTPKSGKWKKFYRKIEKMFDYPIGLTNLRDPDLILPNNSIVSSNPGFAGGMLRPRTEINYRNQWFGTANNSQQMTLSIDNYLYQMRGGVGIILNAKDYQYGGFGDYNMSLVYSPKIILSKNVVFEPAVKFTLGALNANGNQLISDSQFELERGRILNIPAAPQMEGNQQLWYKDYGLGFVLNTKWFYLGFSADNLNQHFENVYNQEGYATPTSTPVLLNGIMGFDYESLNKKMSISPFIAYQQFGNRQELWAGTSFRLNKFIIGGSMSHKLDFIAMIGMKFEKFKLAYQYDQTSSALANESVGSHNLTIRFNGKTKRIK